MTRNMIFGGALVGAIALIGISSLFSDDDGRDWDDDDDHRVRVVVNGETIVTSGSILIEGRGDDIIVVTDDGRINCTDNGGTVIVDREDGNKVEIICD